MPKLKQEDVKKRLKELGVEFSEEDSYSNLYSMMLLAEKKEAPEEPKAIEEVPEEIKEPEKPKEVAEIEDEAVETDAEGVEEKKEPVNPFSSFEDKRPMTGKATQMREKLKKQKQIPITIPLGTEEKVGSTHQVTLNGYTMFILKGIQVYVPEQVHEVLQEKFQHELHVREHPLKISGVKDIKLQEYN